MKLLQTELNNASIRQNQLDGAKQMAERKLQKMEEQSRQETKEEVRRERKKGEEFQREKDTLSKEVASLRATVQNMEAYRSSTDERLNSANAQLEVSENARPVLHDTK